MTSIGGPLRQRRRTRFGGAMVLAIGLLVLTVAVSIWLAFTADAATEVRTDPATGAMVVSGPEQDFVGRVDGQFEGHAISVLGLPAYQALAEELVATRAICALRGDPAAHWSEGSESLRAHLNASEMDRLCAEAGSIG